MTFTKAVTTSGGAQAPAASTAFGFALDCIGTDRTFALAAGESYAVTFTGNTLCSLTETNSQGADSVSGEFSDRLFTGGTGVTVTNHYEVAPAVLGLTISKLLTTANPALIGDGVHFDIAISFSGGLLPNVELVDVYENAYLEFTGLYLGQTALDCTVFPNLPDGAHNTVACAVGDLFGPTTFSARFTALQSTLPGLTLNQASVLSDADGPGGQPPTVTGPAFDDLEIVEVLALPPLGDGGLLGMPLATPLAATLAAGLASIGLAALLAAAVARRGRTHAASAAELSQD